MLLDQVLSLSPAAALALLQRRVNDRLPFRNDQTDVPPEFRPDGPLAGFDLPFALLPEGGCDSFECRPDARLRDLVRTGGWVRFPVHPLMAPHRALEVCGAMWAVPLASVGTVLVEPGGLAFLVKTDLPRRVVFTRRLRRGSLGHSRDVMGALQDAAWPGFSGVLPESISVSLQTTDATGAALETGCVYRELEAWPRAGRPRWLVPFFSLYSLGPARQEPVLLCQLVDRNHRAGEDEFDTFCRIVLVPLIDSVAYLVTEHGLLPEAHAQNTFLEMDHFGRATRIVHSDLQDWCFDRNIREGRGLQCDFARNDVAFMHPRLEGPAEALAYPARQVRYSSLFDFVLGRVLARCGVVLSRYPGCRWDRIKAAARERLTAGLGGLGREILPDRVAFRRYVTESGAGKTLHIRALAPPYR